MNRAWSAVVGLRRRLRWDGDWSLAGQIGLGLAIWAYVAALHLRNNGLWYQGDAPRHAANGLFWWDFLTSLPVSPVDFAVSYYARYPVINPTSYPPAFYLIEAIAYQVFGVTPFVGKSLVLGSVLVGTVYLVAWLRRWVSVPAGWGGGLLALQPAIIGWSHAVMLNVPTTMLAVAALYHWRRWLEDPPSKHFYAAAGCCVFAILTYLQIAVVVLVMLAWAVYEGRLSLLWRPRTLAVVAIAALPVATWGLIAAKGAPGLWAQGFLQGDYPPWTLAAWTFYLERLPALMTAAVLLAAGGAIIVGVGTRAWRAEVSVVVIWAAVTYVWFSAISHRDLGGRYILPVVPPLVILAAIGLDGGLRWAANALGGTARALRVAALMAVVAWHVGLAPSVHVPRAEGFHEIVKFVQEVAPSERVFYDGLYNGVFSFYLRAEDTEFQNGVVLGNKLLYTTKFEAKYGLVEIASSPAEALELVRSECGCRVLIVERQIAPVLAEIRAVRDLRTALATDDSVRLLRSFRVQAGGISDIDVYEISGVASAPSTVDLRFPVLGENARFRARPLQK